VLALHLAIWAAADGESSEGTARAVAARQARAPKTSFAFNQTRVELPDLVATERAHDTKGNGRAAAARGSEGSAGAPRAESDRGHVATQNTGEEPQLSKTAAIEQARRAGILGNERVLEERFRSLTGEDKLTSGFDPHDVTAPLDGADGAARGSFGMGRQFAGSGDDGAGNTIGTVGRGAFSTGTSHGHAWGGTIAVPNESTWSHAWNGPYDVSYHAHSLERVPTLVTICSEPYRDRCRVSGELDAAVVRRYVRRKITSFQYCYEKQLLADPKLAEGPMLVTFAIHPSGNVDGATATGGDSTVASCVRDVIAKTEFPHASERTQGPGITQVEYVLVYRRP
jgi:hypothetical protein